MSVDEVRAVIEQMEAWNLDPSWQPEPEALARWNARFQAAKAGAEQSPEWPEWAVRARSAGRQLEVRIASLSRLRDEMKAELDAQERGNRALKGYGAGLR